MTPNISRLLTRSCWIEVDLDALESNLRQLRKVVGPEVKIMPAVKANGYGLGLTKVCEAVLAAGAEVLACGCIDDAIELRQAGIKAPIFVFASNTVTEVVDLYVQYDLMPTILMPEQAEALSGKVDRETGVFVKIETGRGRIGVPAEEALPFLRQVSSLPNIKVMGVYTHVAEANWPDKNTSGYIDWQFKRFKGAYDDAKAAGLDIPIWQMANSVAAICLPQTRFTGTCVGRLPGGHETLEKRPESPDLKPAMKAWKSRIIQIKKVAGGRFGPKGEAVILEKPATVGVIPCGVYDGLMANQKAGEVLVRGKRVKVWSGISLEHFVIDLSGCPEAQAGDEVVIFGKQGNEEITIADLCKLWGLPLTHFLGHLNPHMARVYFRNGKPIGIEGKSGYQAIEA